MKLKLNLKTINNNKDNNYSQPPGSLNYTGKFTDEPFHGEIYYYDDENVRKIEFNNLQILLNTIETPEYKRLKVKWINVIGLNHIEEMEALGNLFHIPRLEIEDIIHISKHSKFDVINGHIFSELQMMYIANEEIESENLSIVKIDDTVITFQETSGDIFDALRKRINDNLGIVRKRNSDYLYYSILDLLVDNYLKVLYGINTKIDSIEDNIIDNTNVNMNDMYSVKKELLFLKTTVFPMRILKELLQNEDKNWISEELGPYLKDLNDHIMQLIDDINSAREISNNLFESHMLNVNNDMNKVITTLTIFSAIFIPLSFLAGVFGMNFRNFPGLDARYGFYFFIAGCIILAIIMLSIFKKKKWF